MKHVMEHSYENNEGRLAVNQFRKKLHHRCLGGSLICLCIPALTNQ